MEEVDVPNPALIKKAVRKNLFLEFHIIFNFLISLGKGTDELKIQKIGRHAKFAKFNKNFKKKLVF